LRALVAWSLFGLLRLFVTSQTRPGLPPNTWVTAALTASPRSVSARAAPPGLRAVSSPASAAATWDCTVLASTRSDSSPFGDGAPGSDWLKAASTSASPGWTTLPARAATSGLNWDLGSL
jgi:hypothetical protein